MESVRGGQEADRHIHIFHYQGEKVEIINWGAGSEGVGSMATDITGTQRTPQGDLDQRNMSFSMEIWLAPGSTDIKDPGRTGGIAAKKDHVLTRGWEATK